MFSRILIATDGSDVSLRAAAIAIDLAQRLSIGVYIYHVALPYENAAFLTDIYSDPASYSTQTLEYASRSLTDITALATAANVPCESRYEHDSTPHEAIVAAAIDEHCDLIVMGSHGRRGLDRLLLGSETHKVLLNTTLAVLVCR